MEKIIKEINKFRDERNWRQFHNPKDLSISVMLESAELLEKFQWKDSNETLMKDKDGVKDEIADCLIYLLMLTDDLELDLKQIITEKLKKIKKNIQ